MFTSKPELTAAEAQRREAFLADEMERMELRFGNEWLPANWWMILAPLGLWVWWKAFALLLAVL